MWVMQPRHLQVQVSLRLKRSHRVLRSSRCVPVSAPEQATMSVASGDDGDGGVAHRASAYERPVDYASVHGSEPLSVPDRECECPSGPVIKLGRRRDVLVAIVSLRTIGTDRSPVSTPASPPWTLPSPRSGDPAREAGRDSPRWGVPGSVPAGVGFAVPGKRSRPGSTNVQYTPSPSARPARRRKRFWNVRKSSGANRPYIKSDFRRRAAAASGISAPSTFFVSVRIAISPRVNEGDEMVFESSVRCRVSVLSMGVMTPPSRVVNRADIVEGKTNIDESSAIALWQATGAASSASNKVKWGKGRGQQ